MSSPLPHVVPLDPREQTDRLTDWPGAELLLLLLSETGQLCIQLGCKTGGMVGLGKYFMFAIWCVPSAPPTLPLSTYTPHNERVGKQGMWFVSGQYYCGNGSRRHADYDDEDDQEDVEDALNAIGNHKRYSRGSGGARILRTGRRRGGDHLPIHYEEQAINWLMNNSVKPPLDRLMGFGS